MQVAKIIKRASMSGVTESSSGRKSTSGVGDSAVVEKQPPPAPPRAFPQYVEDLMSSEQLIEEFGLQSLLENPGGGHDAVEAGG